MSDNILTYIIVVITVLVPVVALFMIYIIVAILVAIVDARRHLKAIRLNLALRLKINPELLGLIPVDQLIEYDTMCSDIDCATEALSQHMGDEWSSLLHLSPDDRCKILTEKLNDNSYAMDFPNCPHWQEVYNKVQFYHTSILLNEVIKDKTNTLKSKFHI